MARRDAATLCDPMLNLPLSAVRATIELIFAPHRHPPQVMVVEQWSASNNRHGTTPSGSLMAAWVRDAAGLRPISEAERQAYHSPEPQEPFTLFQFFVEPDGKHVVVSVISGPRAGHGGRYEVATGPAGPVLVGYGDWVS